MVESAAPLASGPAQCPTRFSWWQWAMVFVVSLSLFAATANRGPQWQDSGEKILRICKGELINPLGLALTHALHFWLGRLALRLSSAEPAYLITLVSCIAAALAVANVYGCVMALTGRWPAALFAAASLALANTFWQLATLAEAYTLTAALLAAECWCMVIFAQTGRRTALLGMFVFNGMGVANHLLAGLTTPVLAVVAVTGLRSRRVHWVDVLLAALLWLAASLPYTGLVASHALHARNPDGTLDLAGTLRSALMGDGYGENVLNVSISLRLLGVAAAFVLFNFPNLLLPAAACGLVVGRRLKVPALARRALLAGLIVHALFVLRYNITDQHTFFLPTYTLLCLFGGIGAAAMLNWSARWRRCLAVSATALLCTTPLVYWGVATTARQHQWFRNALRHKPYRDDYTYLFIPWSRFERSAARMSGHAVDLAAPDGLVVLEDGMARFAIEYRMMREDLPHIHVRLWPGQDHPQAVADLMLRARATLEIDSSVVLVPLNVDKPVVPAPAGMRWDRDGDLYVLAADDDP